jgi:hypothetical protein
MYGINLSIHENDNNLNNNESNFKYVNEYVEDYKQELIKKIKEKEEKKKEMLENLFKKKGVYHCNFNNQDENNDEEQEEQEEQEDQEDQEDKDDYWSDSDTELTIKKINGKTYYINEDTNEVYTMNENYEFEKAGNLDSLICK